MKKYFPKKKKKNSVHNLQRWQPVLLCTESSVLLYSSICHIWIIILPSGYSSLWDLNSSWRTAIISPVLARKFSGTKELCLHLLMLLFQEPIRVLVHRKTLDFMAKLLRQLRRGNKFQLIPLDFLGINNSTVNYN